MTHALRHPLVHFLLLGALLHAGQGWLPTIERASAVQTIRVTPAQVNALQRDWQRETGRPPNEVELQSLLRRHLDEEILLREALSQQLHRSDPVARERLVTNLRFAFPESESDDAALVDEAERLGMHRRDLVVQRRLVRLMEMRIAAGANFSEDELREYVQQHAVRYAPPARLAFTQAFFSVDRPDAETRARDALAAAEKVTPIGDAFLHGAHFGLLSRAEIQRRFGLEFTEAVSDIEPGQWVGPLRSAYGWHLVRVDAREPGAPPDFEAVRQRAAYALLAEREREQVEAQMIQLRKRYRVEWPADELLLGRAP